MYLSVSRQNDQLMLTAFSYNQNIRPIKVEKLSHELLAIVSSGDTLIAFSEKGQILLYNAELVETAYFQLYQYKHAKYDVYGDFIAAYSQEIVEGRPPGITIFKIADGELVEISFCACSEPTHIACYSSLVCAYFKVGKNKYYLTVFEVYSGRKYVFNLRERCKTLKFDWNGELVLITKGPLGKYTFYRFYAATGVPDDVMPDLQQIGSQGTENTRDSDNDEAEEVYSPEQHGIDEILRTSTAKTLSYYFRTCIPSENVVIAGRFDSYVAMENKNNPISCVLHSHYRLSPSFEKVCVDWTNEGYFICYVSQDYYYINIVRQYNLDYVVSLKAKDIQAFTFLNFQQKIEDIALLRDSTMVCLCRGCLVSFGPIGHVIVQKYVEMQRFCFDAQKTSVLFINNSNIILYIIENGQLQCYRENASTQYRSAQPADVVQVIEADEIAPDYVEFDRQAKVVKYFKKENNVEIWWYNYQGGQQGESARSLVPLEPME